MEPLDWESLRENCAGDDSLMHEVLDLFRKEADGLLADVQKAVAARDGLAVKRAAHRLKGALVSLAAKPSTEAARALEIAGSSNDLQQLDAQCQRLSTELHRLLEVLSLKRAA